jgi:hypothetical protein
VATFLDLVTIAAAAVGVFVLIIFFLGPRE